jgi:Haem-degrading
MPINANQGAIVLFCVIESRKPTISAIGNGCALPFSGVEPNCRKTNSLLMSLLVGSLTRVCPAVGLASLANGLQIFPGSVPLYKNGKLVGAIGISGDGVDQDDIIAAMGSTGFEAPEGLRTDQVFVRGTRLPYVKFPRNPNRD